MSASIMKYLNQTAQWARRTGTDEYGMPERQAVIIRCRMEKRTRLTQDAAGRDVTSSVTCYIAPPDGVTSGEDLIGDTIDGLPVLQVSEMRNAAGQIIGYEVAL